MLAQIIVIVVLIVLDVYVFQAVKVGAAHRSSVARTSVYYLFWGFTVFSVFVMFLTGIIDYHVWPKGFRQYTFGIIVVVYLSKLFLFPFVLLDDIIRIIRWIASLFVIRKKSLITPVKKTRVISRLEFLHYTGLVIAAIPFSTLVYGMMYGKYRYKVRHVKIIFPGLPTGFNGFKIIQLSDIHIGSFMSREPVAKAVKMINELNADVIFFTGDLVNDLASETYDYLDLLSEIKASQGIYSILGNHDYGDYIPWQKSEDKIANLDTLKSVQGNLGWRLLLNENTTITKNDDKISLIGVENWSAIGRFPKYGDLDKAMTGVDPASFKILLSHDPSHWSHEVTEKYPGIDLTLSGHTHGMQFGVEIPGFKWSPVQYVYKQWAGLYQEANQYLYVNRGLGFIGYPGRVGILPEITLFELSNV